MNRFYLGVHRPSWLETLDVPLFVSHRQLAPRRTLPRAITPWALDSGGFTELDKFGRWVTPVDDYVAAVARYAREIGQLAWAAPMDWMCEEGQREKTGLSVEEHQRLTVANFLELRGRGPFIPVLQGWTLDDYARCAAMYEAADVNLVDEKLVGVGSICKRQNDAEVSDIIASLSPLRLHGFGVKKTGIAMYGHLLASADSMAWSSRARWAESPLLPGCAHRNCANCPEWALAWRARLLARPSLFDQDVA